jgi:rhamnose transport system permease protein
MNRLVPSLLRLTPWLIAALVLALDVFWVRAFRRPAYWLTLSDQYFTTAALALALTPIMLTGGIDLSVGSMTVLSSVVVGVLWQGLGWPISWALAGGVAAGLVAGLANGLLVSVGVWPLVATLATRELYRGLAFTLSGDAPVDRFPLDLVEFWHTPIAGLPLSLVVLAVLFLLTWLGVHHTWVGRALFALGDNETAARFAALPVRRLKLGLYAWSGLVAGLCGISLVMHYGAAKAGAERSLELTAIACVVLGGIRVTGGAGHVAGTLVGIVTVSALQAGLSSTYPNWREIMTGALLIGVALANEAAARRLRV